MEEKKHYGQNSFVPATREEWLQINARSIGGSKIAAILGINPYLSPWQLWREMTGRCEKQGETWPMVMGNAFEDGVATLFEHVTGNRIIKRSAVDVVYFHPKYTFIAGTPDRRVFLNDDSGKKGVLEAKTTAAIYDYDNIPPWWFCQLQIYLGLTGLKTGYIAWFEFRTRELKHQEYDFDREYYNEMVEFAVQWHQKHIVEDVEPELTTADDVLRKFPKHAENKEVEASSNILDAFTNLESLTEAEKTVSEEIDRFKEQVKLFMQDAERVRYADQTLFTFKATNPKPKFNETQFKAEHPELWKTYLYKPEGSRVFRIAKQ
jgi:putative phage-type endonuclease